MIIGSLNIAKKDDLYQFSHSKEISNDNNSNFSILLQSFQLEYESILYCANSIQTLDKFIETSSSSSSSTFTLKNVNILLSSLYEQIVFLRENNISISFIDLTDIIVVDSNLFFFCNYDKLFFIKEEKITVTHFYDLDNPFLPPEFIHNDTIPFSTSDKSFFYSLGIIILHCLKQGQLFRFSTSSYLDVLEYYKYHQIHFTLLECMKQDPYKRKLFIF